MKPWILLAPIALFTLPTSSPVLAPSPSSAPSLSVHEKALVADLHVDTLFQMATRGYSIAAGAPAPQGYTPEVTVDLLRRGGVDAETFAIWVPNAEMKNPGAYAKRALAIYQEMTKDSPDLAATRTANEIYRANGEGKIAALLSIEGAEAIGTRAEDLRPWAEVGVSLLGISWNRPNAFADAAQAKEKPFGGLSAEGEALVDLAGELGVLIDISHTSDDSFWDVMARTRRPVVASHSSARSVFAHPRNLDDEQIRAIRASGGVVALNFHAPFLSAKKGVSLEDAVAHILHLVEVGGPSVVALGSDFDGMIQTPEGLRDISKLPDLTARLLEAGLTPEDVDLMLGRNFVRALAKAQGEYPLAAGSIPIPLAVQKAKASSALSGAEAQKATDRNQRTFWKADPKDPAPTLEISGQGEAPRRIALRGPVGGPLTVEVTLTVGVQESETKRVEIPEDPSGVGLLFPEMSGTDWSVTVTFLQSGAVGLAEVVAYDR